MAPPRPWGRKFLKAAKKYHEACEARGHLVSECSWSEHIQLHKHAKAWHCHRWSVSASWFSSRPPSMLFQNCLLRQTDPGCITRSLVLVSVAPAVIGATSRKVGIAISWPVKYGSSPPNSPPANYHWYNPWDQVFCCRISSIDGQVI